MKQLLCMLALAMPFLGVAQQPVQWNYSIEKVKGNQYKLRVSARIQSGYHVFALTQPEDAIATPTRISIASEPYINDVGVFREEGVLEKVRDADFGIESWHYSDKVDFVSVITLKNSKARALLSGVVEYQVCSADKCYPPTKVNFSIPLNH